MKKARLLILVTSGIALIFSIWLVQHHFFPSASDTPAPPPVSRPPVMVPDLQMLAARAMGDVIEPTPEEIEEEKRVTQEQIETASAWLSDANPEQRVTGAEQLSAYPTPEAEKLLVESLANDSVPEVRAEAAQSLDSFEKLEESTVQALLAALEDPDEDVRENALSTLQGLHDRLEGDGKIKDAKKIFAGLKKKSRSPQVPAEMQKNIRDYLRDLQ